MNVDFKNSQAWLIRPLVMVFLALVLPLALVRASLTAFVKFLVHNTLLWGWSSLSWPKEADDIQKLRTQAQAGDSQAQFELARLYDLGEDVERDLPQAIHWYGQAAAQNHALAQFYLGELHEHGVGMPINLAQARDLYQKAAAQGHKPALAALRRIDTST